MNQVKTPWIKNLGGVPSTLAYPEGTMVEAVEKIADTYPSHLAYDFMGAKSTYQRLVRNIHACARSLTALGIQKGDRVTICMPNAPQTIWVFYAVNLIGAIANMVHPLSGEKEIEFYLKDSNSVACLTLDQCYPKFKAIRTHVPALKHLIITSVSDEMAAPIKLGYRLTEGRKTARVQGGDGITLWRDFLRLGKSVQGNCRAKQGATDAAAILYSGGTTGTTKGILLSNLNFNALGRQIQATNPMFNPGDKMLSIMPMFHGFGLGVCIHSMLMLGGECLLVPRFTPESYAKLLKKYRPHFIAGVPTLYEALLRVEGTDGLDLSSLKGVFSGGDSLSIELKKRFDAFLKAHKALIEVREGYGTTECVTASCLTPVHMSREGSIGLPFPDTFYKIVKVGTEEEVPYGAEGEICLSGPTVMMEYVNQPVETANTLKKHTDGLTWVHTGDLGVMDEDGFIYFRQRIKRMIITSGYNVYPSQIENVLDAHEKVHMSCVIGVKDEYKMQRVKAFVMLKPGVKASEEVKAELITHCEKHCAKYAVPREIEFRDQLPKTLVGKVAYRELEEQEQRLAS